MQKLNRPWPDVLLFVVRPNPAAHDVYTRGLPLVMAHMALETKHTHSFADAVCVAHGAHVAHIVREDQVLPVPWSAGWLAFRRC